jgi:phosphopantetheine adenylyltransferase
MAASVGFYAGTFDPPTQAQIAIIRCAFRGLLVSLKNAKKSQRRDFTLGGFGE